MDYHTMRFADEAAARAALPGFGSDDQGTWAWDASTTVPGQRVILTRAVWGGSAAAPELVTPEEAVQGYFISVLSDAAPGPVYVPPEGAILEPMPA